MRGAELALPRLIVAIVLAAAGSSATAQSRDIYKCQDDQGRTVFQDQGRGKGCERLDIYPVATIPGTRARSGATPAAPAAKVLTPANFPRADGDAQQQREVDRRRILEDEVRLEEERLARLRGEFNNGTPAPIGDEKAGTPRYQERSQRLREDIERSEANLASLRRELAPLRY